MKKSTKRNDLLCTPGERLRDLRKRQHLTQADLADEVSKLQEGSKRTCNEKSISNIENGRKMSRNYAHLFSLVLGVSEEYLLCESDFPTEQAKLEASRAAARRTDNYRILERESFAALSGYELRAMDPDQLMLDLPDDLCAPIHDCWALEKDGERVFLSSSELSELEATLDEVVANYLKAFMMGRTTGKRRRSNNGQH